MTLSLCGKRSKDRQSFTKGNDAYTPTPIYLGPFSKILYYLYDQSGKYVNSPGEPAGFFYNAIFLFVFLRHTRIPRHKLGRNITFTTRRRRRRYVGLLCVRRRTYYNVALCHRRSAATCRTVLRQKRMFSKTLYMPSTVVFFHHA